jgi:hypothetical protein
MRCSHRDSCVGDWSDCGGFGGDLVGFGLRLLDLGGRLLNRCRFLRCSSIFRCSSSSIFRCDRPPGQCQENARESDCDAESETLVSEQPGGVG